MSKCNMQCKCVTCPRAVYGVSCVEKRHVTKRIVSQYAVSHYVTHCVTRCDVAKHILSHVI